MTNQINTNGGNSSPQKNETNIFVYGSLREGLPLSPALSSATHVATCKSESKYTMYDLGAFPCILKGGETQIVGDLYIVDDETLARLDLIEGVPVLYNRDIIDIYGWEQTDVYAYFFTDEKVQANTIENGDWKVHKGLSNASI